MADADGRTAGGGRLADACGGDAASAAVILAGTGCGDSTSTAGRGCLVRA